MAIAFRSATSIGFASRTNTVLTAPAGIANGDILICTLVTAANPTAPTPTPPAGFTAFGTATSVVDPSGLNGKFWIFWKRAASESGSYTFTHTTASTQGLLKAYSGCLASGTPLGATSNNTGAGTADSVGTTITTTAANSFLLFEEHDWEGTTTLTPPSGMTERFDSLVYSADQLIASAGATGTRTMTNGNGTVPGDRWAVRMVELLVDTGGAGPATGTLSATLGAATAAATGKVLVGGTSAVTLGAATGTITGKVTVAGSYVGTLFPAMLVATGTVDPLGIGGTLTTTLGNATLAGAGVVTTPARTGTLNVTLQDATLFAVSMPQRYATLNVSLGDATLLALGHVPAYWTRAAPPSAVWQIPPRAFIRVTMESVGGDRIRITEDGAIRITAYEIVGRWVRTDFANAVWTKE